MKKTPLHARHLALNAKMGEFAGYDMPLYYGEGVLKEHEWVRTHAGLFDISHMGQIILSVRYEPGKMDLNIRIDTVVGELLEKLTPSSFRTMQNETAKYTVMTNPAGGIIDDMIVSRLGFWDYYVVLNAGCKEKDIAWIKSQLPADGSITFEELDYALVALQGPEAAKVMKEAFNFDAANFNYMEMMETQDIYISRLGYTGEDGFEIAFHHSDAEHFWDMLSQHPSVKPIGLAARDSLRLEMGYCLYGHDIDETTTPLEANLGWIMRPDAKAQFPEPQRKRVGVKLTGKGIAREGAEIFDRAGVRKIGTLTSGTFSPTLKQAIGQGYVETGFAKAGTEIAVNVRGNMIEAIVEKMPFIEPKTKK